MNRKIVALLLAVACLLAIVIYFAANFMAPVASMTRPVYRAPEDSPGFRDSVRKQQAKKLSCRAYSETPFRDYAIHAYDQSSCPQPPPGQSRIEIWQAGQLIYTLKGHVALGYGLDEDQPPDGVKIKVGDDLTGDGIPELLVSEWSGGTHCCYTFHLFRMGERFSHIQDIALLDADEATFVRRPGVKGLVLVTNDYSAFAYFPEGFAGSPAGRVFLSFQGDKFQPDARLMKSNPPTDTEITKCAGLFKPSRAWKEKANAGQPMGMWYYATDLIYTGNARQAWKFLDAAWGGSAAEKKKYVGDYQQRFTKSVYYQELLQLQQTPLTAASQKIDWSRHCFDYLRG